MAELTTLRIGPVTFNIKLVLKLNGINGEGTGMEWLNGRILWQDSLIEIEQGLNPEMRKVALLHESLHGILEQAGILEHPEPIIIALSYGVLQLLLGNPDLVRYLIEPSSEGAKMDILYRNLR